MRVCVWMLVLPALPLAAALPGCRLGAHLEGSGVAKTESRSVSEFSEVDVSGAVRLRISIGSPAGVAVTADDNILPYVVTRVVGRRLEVFVDRSVSTSLGVEVSATTPALDRVEGSGATKTTLAGVSASELRIGLSGASTCAATGTARRLTIQCSGASRVDAIQLEAEVVKVDVSGASKVEVNAARELTGGASGASTVRYAGAPAQLETSTSGASSIRPK